MHRHWSCSLLIAGMLALGGCAAGIAASAVGMAVRSARSEPRSNAHLGSMAARACSAHAAQYGTVHVIDVEQRSASRIVVWGTVGEGLERRSFECRFGTQIAHFRLRAITPRP